MPELTSPKRRSNVPKDDIVSSLSRPTTVPPPSPAGEGYALRDLWIVENKFYDFSGFVDRHPGGASFISVGKGRDCTELFKSVHQLSDVNFEKLFAKYEVTKGFNFKYVPDPSSQFDWSEKSVFQSELTHQVRSYFKDRKLSHKASWSFWTWFAFHTVAMLFVVFKTVTERSYFMSVFAGTLLMSWGFAIMHTGSHGGLSNNHWINWSLFASFCNCLGWWHHLWLQHHVYGHHSYTGLYGKDPDVTNMPQEWCRKHLKTKYLPQHKYNIIIELFVLTFIPSQFLAQGMDYVASLWKGTVFGLPVVHVLTWRDVLITWLEYAVWFTTFVYTPISSTGLGHMRYIFVMYLTLGIFYWAFVETNHETIEVHEASVEIGGKSADWAVHQIVHSSNFEAPSLMTFFIGGMNFQIEHHLFPSVHPCHYPAISKIVKNMCAKYKVSYVCHKSWIHATVAHIKFLDVMSKVA